MHGAIALTRDFALLWCELNPGLHLSAHALLLVGRQGRIALGDAQPLLFAPRVEAVPFAGKRRQHLLVVGAKLLPSGRRSQGSLRISQRRQERENTTTCYSSECLSQLLKPWSRYASIGNSLESIAASVSSMSFSAWVDCQY